VAIQLYQESEDKMARISAVLEYASFFPKYTYILPGCGLAKI
jgi:hypothetical protein